MKKNIKKMIFPFLFVLALCVVSAVTFFNTFTVAVVVPAASIAS